MSQPPPPPHEPHDPSEAGGQPPAGQNPYGQYGQNPYGQNPYGQAPPGQAPYGQSPFGQSPYGAPQEPQGGKGLAVAALVLAFLPLCLTQVIAFVLAIVVLVSKRAGKGLAIAAMIVAVVMTVVTLALAAVVGLIAGGAINDLEDGQCITAEGLTDEESETVSQVEVVDCSEPHDGEIVATDTLDADEAEAYSPADVQAACGPLVSQELLASLPENVEVTALTQSAEPSEGDQLVCVAYPTDGNDLTERLD